MTTPLTLHERFVQITEPMANLFNDADVSQSLKDQAYVGLADALTELYPGGKIDAKIAHPSVILHILQQARSNAPLVHSEMDQLIYPCWSMLVTDMAQGVNALLMRDFHAVFRARIAPLVARYPYYAQLPYKLYGLIDINARAILNAVYNTPTQLERRTAESCYYALRRLFEHAEQELLLIHVPDNVNKANEVFINFPVWNTKVLKLTAPHIAAMVTRLDIMVGPSNLPAGSQDAGPTNLTTEQAILARLTTLETQMAQFSHLMSAKASLA